MSEEKEVFVDPNSGAAPQPGSWAGKEATEKGFGPPSMTAGGESALEEEPVPSAYEAPGAQPVPESVSAAYPALADEAAQKDVEQQESGSEDDSDDVVPEELQPSGDPGAEAEAVAAKELETEATTAGAGEVENTDPDGTHPSVLPVEDGVTPPDQPADGEGNPVEAEAGNSRAPQSVEGEASLDSREAKDYSELLDKNVPDVVEYLEKHPEEKDAVIAAEQKRENPRKGVLEA